MLFKDCGRTDRRRRRTVSDHNSSPWAFRRAKKYKIADGGHICRRTGAKFGLAQQDHQGNIPDKFRKNPTHSPKWYSHCKCANVIQHFSNPVSATNERIIIWAVLGFEQKNVIIIIILPYICLFVLKFYGLVNPIRSCRVRSFNLTTLLLGRLRPLSG